MPSAETILLDTHVWIWIRAGETASLRRASLDAIARAGHRSALKVSVISAWEVAMLASKGRVMLGLSTLDWVRRALSAPGVSLAELTPEIAVESCSLPGEFHGDPGDRMIVATARITGATLYTKDERILAYGRLGHAKVVAV
jgi:PIN domain nuclease of toxin-antitoxin system